MGTAVPTILERIRAAIDAHDANGLAACFSEDYRNETPAHPDRSFTGREQVRANWTTILRSVPDLRAELVSWGTSPHDPEAVWAEWAWAGRRADGAAVGLRGVTVLGVRQAHGTALVEWARFYMEPVDAPPSEPAERGVAAAVRRAVGGAR